MFWRLIQTHSDKMASSLNFDVVVAFFGHVEGLVCAAKRKKYSFDHEYILLGFLPVESAQVKTTDVEGGRETDMSQ